MTTCHSQTDVPVMDEPGLLVKYSRNLFEGLSAVFDTQRQFRSQLSRCWDPAAPQLLLIMLSHTSVIKCCKIALRAAYDIWHERLAEFRPVLHTGTETSAPKQQSLDTFCHGRSSILIMSLRFGAGLDGLQQVSCDDGPFAQPLYDLSEPVSKLGARNGFTAAGMADVGTRLRDAAGTSLTDTRKGRGWCLLWTDELTAAARRPAALHHPTAGRTSTSTASKGENAVVATNPHTTAIDDSATIRAVLESTQPNWLITSELGKSRVDIAALVEVVEHTARTHATRLAAQILERRGRHLATVLHWEANVLLDAASHALHVHRQRGPEDQPITLISFKFTEDARRTHGGAPDADTVFDVADILDGVTARPPATGVDGRDARAQAEVMHIAGAADLLDDIVVDAEMASPDAAYRVAVGCGDGCLLAPALVELAAGLLRDTGAPVVVEHRDLEPTHSTVPSGA